MKKFLFFLAILIACLLQVTILNYFKIFNIAPDLLLIFVVIAGLTFELRWALIFGLFAGLLKDVFSTNAFGINSALFVLWGYLIVILNRQIAIENNALRAGLVFIVALLHDILAGLVYLYSGNLIPLGVFLRIVILQPIYTALFLPLVFKSIKPVYYLR